MHTEAPAFFDWQPEALYERLQPLLAGSCAPLGLSGMAVEAVAETGSTNTDLLDQARQGDTSAVVRVATRQTAGRGRRGRAWHSAQAQPGASLAFSVGLPIDLAERSGAAWSGLSLAVGVALAEALSPTATTPAPTQAVQVKWPNDLWWRGRKLAGILIESTHGYAVVGVGINIAPVDELTKRDVSTGFACVGELAMQGPSGLGPSAARSTTAELAVQTLHTAAEAVLRAVAELKIHGFDAAFASRFAARDALSGQTVSVSGPPPIEGVACGVDALGALLVHTAAGMRAVNSSEVSVRAEAPRGR